MSDVKKWDEIAANNTDAPPDGAPEGHKANKVNNITREMMAAIARWYRDPGWTDFDDTPTFIATNSFRVSGDLTARYLKDRRIRAGVGAGTIYGIIDTSSFSTNTDVNVRWDSGVLDSSLSAVAVGVNIPDQSWIKPQGRLLSFQYLTASGTYVKPVSVTRLLVEAVGGGGGGGGSDSNGAGAVSAAGGGGGGGYLRKWLTSPSDSISYSIGAGGAAGGAGAAGGTGSPTIFDTSLSAGGGSGGGKGTTTSTNGISALGNGGGSSGGDFAIAGDQGAPGVGIATGVIWGGKGGASVLGRGGIAIQTQNSGQGAAANTGGGGGGAGSGASAAGNVGGAGGSGRIVVWEFE